MNAKTSEEVRNEEAIRALYALAEGNAKDTFKFVSGFTDDGYFYDVAADKKYFGRDIGVTVDVYAAAFPECTGSSTRSAASATMSWWNCLSTAPTKATSSSRRERYPPPAR